MISPKLTKDEAEPLEGPVTLDEASETPRKMKNGKSPGTDVVTVDFKKFFRRQLVL